MSFVLGTIFGACVGFITFTLISVNNTKIN